LKEKKRREEKKVDGDIVEEIKREILLKRYCLGSRMLVLCALPFFYKNHNAVLNCSPQ